MSEIILTLVCIILYICYATAQGLTKCECVPNGTCYPNTLVDGTGVIDVRIVNGNGSVTPPTPCTGGKVQCCTECGVSYNITSAPRPGAGQSAYGAQPWQTVILDLNNTYVGGGVLLDESHVLTAAHKVYRRVPASIKVRLGEWDASREIEPFQTQEALVATISIFDNYTENPKNLFNDIAMLRLFTPIKYGPAHNPAINTACLPTASTSFANMRCIVSGWGHDAFEGSYQAVLRQVDVPMVDSDNCQRILRTTKLTGAFVLNKNSFICAGGEAGKDACVGDGGSPLMCNVRDKYQVAGLVAWGIGCGGANIPGVYVRVQSYLTWINKHLAQ